MAYRILDYYNTEKLISRIFTAYGFNDTESERITDSILTADLFGIESHGIQRMMRYANSLNCGMIIPEAKTEIVFETPVSAVIDAHDAMGQVAASRAMELAIKKAETSGIGIVSVRNSNHYGIAGYYTKMAYEKDLMGICMTNSEPIMVPTNGKKAMLGTNPIALTMPADPYPFSFDAATTVVPLGKLEVYKKKGEEIPEGWALGENGDACIDPASVISDIISRRCGGLLPIGGKGTENAGHKGYGFAMICEIFTSVLSGGPASHNTYKGNGRAETSQSFAAIDYGIFGDKKEIRSSFSSYLNELRASPKADENDRIYTHGEKEYERYAGGKEIGIKADEKTVDELKEICRGKGIDLSEYGI